MLKMDQKHFMLPFHHNNQCLSENIPLNLKISLPFDEKDLKHERGRRYSSEQTMTLLKAL